MSPQTGNWVESLPGKKAKCMLIVDDEPIMRTLCSRPFRDWRILQADNGKDALTILAKEEVDLVLTDVMMPDMNGLELLRTIKESNPDQTVIIMTGLGDRDVVVSALHADADDFISKPIDLLQLQTTVEKVLQKKRLKGELLRLKHMDSLKSEFLGLISHKLNTPITTISLFIQNLAQGIGEPQSKDYKQNMEMVCRESEYLADLVQDLLQFSDFILQDAPLHIELIDLKIIAQTVLLKKTKLAITRGVRVIDTLPAFPLLPMDRRRLFFVIDALLDNAIKFTPPGGNIHLRGGMSDTTIQLVIADSGRGIPASELGKVFEKFYQIDPDNTGQVRGFGLGLFYARQFLLDHGGHLQLQSALGEGTQATITLPRPSTPRS